MSHRPIRTRLMFHLVGMDVFQGVFGFVAGVSCFAYEMKATNWCHSKLLRTLDCGRRILLVYSEPEGAGREKREKQALMKSRLMRTVPCVITESRIYCT